MCFDVLPVFCSVSVTCLSEVVLCYLSVLTSPGFIWLVFLGPWLMLGCCQLSPVCVRLCFWIQSEQELCPFGISCLILWLREFFPAEGSTFVIMAWEEHLCWCTDWCLLPQVDKWLGGRSLVFILLFPFCGSGLCPSLSALSAVLSRPPNFPSQPFPLTYGSPWGWLS